MSASVNKAIILGYVGNDPEVKSINTGRMVANLSIATTRNWKNANGEKQEKTEWHRCVFWDRQAEIVQEYVKKGSLLYVEGSIETRKWTDRDGNDRYTTEIIVNSLQLLPSSKDPRPVDVNGADDFRSGTGFERKTTTQQSEPTSPVQPKENGTIKDPDDGLGLGGDEETDVIPF